MACKRLRHLFWPVFSLALLAALAFALWSGQKENVSYRAMACAFEERSPVCLDSVAEWRRGLAFFDSAYAVSGDALESLKSLLWGYWNIEFAGAGDNAVARDAILPLRVLETKKSGCMGLSWLAMMVAESRGVPLNAILLPGHSYTDEEYREKYKDGNWTGFEFRPLTPAQFVGLAAFDMGNLYPDSDVRRALTWYRMAEEFFPEYPGISVNQEIAKGRLPANPLR